MATEMHRALELHSMAMVEHPGVVHHPDMVYIPGGTFIRGRAQLEPVGSGRSTLHVVTVSGFWMDVTPVTNADFARFVLATGYMTVAERQQANAAHVYRKGAWAHEPGAYWREPEGPGSSLVGRYSHPVVHIAYVDALSYARWAHKDLPTEVEWEFAARADVPDYCSIFPDAHVRERGTLSARASLPNAYGVYEMLGNVWQWTRDSFGDEHAPTSRSACNPETQGGESAGEGGSVRRRLIAPRKILKGGSYLCAPDVCGCRRPAARYVQAIDTVACHIGFRCVLRASAGALRSTASS